ncbi:hypothetical protein NPIL_438661 [Nephila pilipes]|uniref:Uncharacterized protein n=1 Tax=Nephila pilipes TaxID=299642 RepID=A0A8X6MRW6_NEPPI|nr:hypothetical protein NPIL_438661 [Nephila pilipes]
MGGKQWITGAAPDCYDEGEAGVLLHIMRFCARTLSGWDSYFHYCASPIIENQYCGSPYEIGSGGFLPDDFDDQLKFCEDDISRVIGNVTHPCLLRLDAITGFMHGLRLHRHRYTFTPVILGSYPYSFSFGLSFVNCFGFWTKGASVVKTTGFSVIQMPDVWRAGLGLHR